MTWLDDLSYVFGGGFLANAVPHFVNGVMGRPFQSPFAKPPGEGLIGDLHPLSTPVRDVALGAI
jgi:hypothetical protein